MLKEIKILKHHGKQYVKNLRNQPVSGLFRGRPEISDNLTGHEIENLFSLCPSGAIGSSDGSIDMGKCVFCRECSFLLPDKIKFTSDFRIAVNRREDLVIKPGVSSPVRIDESGIRKEIRKIYRKSLKLRQVSAGGDNSCEMELNATGNVNFDFGRYGVEFVASPRHADGIVITGPVTENMAKALQLTYEAVPEPKIIILAGTDAISGGMFSNSEAVSRKFIEEHHIDLFVPGNPAHPLTFINGVMDLLGIR
ncbi:MAG: NADH:ubiquinone oxidoreductase [Bacteroidales bacterium]|nr:NADH:ubiquinone oxidoreductase [Bacteroidales bacterium]